MTSQEHLFVASILSKNIEPHLFLLSLSSKFLPIFIQNKLFSVFGGYAVMQVLLYTKKGQMLHPGFKCKKARIQISKRIKVSMWESHANRVHQSHLQQRPESTKSNHCTIWGIDGSWIGNTFPLRCNSLS